MKQTLLKTAVKQITDNFPTNFAELTNDTVRFLDPCSYAVLFSDFLFGIAHDENIMQMLYEKYESSFEDVSVELYCDTENCRQFLGFLTLRIGTEQLVHGTCVVLTRFAFADTLVLKTGQTGQHVDGRIVAALVQVTRQDNLSLGDISG